MTLLSGLGWPGWRAVSRPSVPRVRDDADAVAGVFLAARAAAMPYLPDVHAPEETRAWIRDVVLGEHDVRVAEVDGAMGAFLALGAETVEHLSVRPELQGCGIGSALLDVAKALRGDGFRLRVSSGARALGASTSGRGSAWSS